MGKSITKILFATDGSEGSLKAARFAAKIARSCDAAITALAAHDEDALVLNAMGPAVWPGAIPNVNLDITKVKEETEESTEKSILTAAREALRDIPKVDSVQIWGHVAEAICDYARDNEYDLIVIGSRGRSAFKRLLLGSVSMQVAQHAPCPVTIVH